MTERHKVINGGDLYEELGRTIKGPSLVRVPIKKKKIQCLSYLDMWIFTVMSASKLDVDICVYVTGLMATEDPVLCRKLQNNGLSWD